MKKSQLAVLDDQERLMLIDVTPKGLAKLDEDEVVALHTQIRRARNKYVGQYRRTAAKRVKSAGGRGKARPTNSRAKAKAEVFEYALAEVSNRLAVLAQQSADSLREERIAAARAAKQGHKVKATAKSSQASTAKPGKLSKPKADVHATAQAKKQRAATRATQARKQAKRDAK